MSRKYIIGLDIGTTKVCAAVARVEGGSVEIVGAGETTSSGLRKGVVVDIDVTTESIRAALREAESTSGVEPRTAYVGVAGGHIECIKSYGATGIKGAEITTMDVDRVMDSAGAVYVPLDREVLHVLPTDFVIDGQDGIVRPLGMSGARLEANVRIITASHSAVENLLKCCRKAGLEVVQAVFEPVASTRAVARREELDVGVAVVDIGGGTSDVTVYREGTLRHASVLAVGGNHVTNDVAIGLRLSQREAERVKTESGFATGDYDFSECIEVQNMNNTQRQVPRRYLGEIIRPRSEEMLKLIKAEIDEATLMGGPSCVVLTGGGALMPGLDRLAEAVFGLPARVGVPEGVPGGLLKGRLGSPAHATGVGLVLYGREAESDSYDGIFSGIMRRVRGTTKNLLEVRGWGLLKRGGRKELRA